VSGLLSRLRSTLLGHGRIGSPLGNRIRGFDVVVENTTAGVDTGAVLARLDEALALIERYQPWRLAHMRRDVRGFQIVRFPCRGAYLPGPNTCLTELTFLARTDITAAPIAASIVHEAMHARTYAMISAYSHDPAREERICRRAELDFGEALPPALGAPVIQRALESLALSDSDVAPVIDWDEARRRQDEVDQHSRAG
jgi:hypothetical protein